MRPSISQGEPAGLADKLLLLFGQKIFVQQAESQDSLNYNLPPDK
jgi:hypothetical protein